MEIVIRASIIFFFLLLLTRGLKKRTLADIAPFEMLLLVTLGTGVGSGIVWDSVDRDEYDECLIKARMVQASSVNVQRSALRIPSYVTGETLAVGGGAKLGGMISVEDDEELGTLLVKE